MQITGNRQADPLETTAETTATTLPGFLQPEVLAIIMMVSLIVALKMLPRLMAAGIPFVEPSDVQGLIDGGKELLIVDVRSSREFAAGHIPGAVNLPLAELRRKLKEVEGELDAYRNETIFITCATQNRSPHGARIFRKQDFKDVNIVKGGVKKWKRAGLPLSQGEAD